MIHSEQLQEFPFFARMEERERELLEGHIYERELPQGRYLFREGGLAENLYVLVEGTIQMTAHSSTDNRQETVMEILYPGDTFLLAAVLSQKPYLMSAQAMEDCRVLAIPSEILIQLILTEGNFALNLLSSLSEQFRSMVRQVKDLRLRSSAQRAAAFLLELAQEEGRNEITLPHSKRLLASRLGMTPERLSRTFATLREHGVEVRGSHIRIHSPAKLRKFCGFDEALDVGEREILRG